MLVSVIIPVYNAEKYVHIAVESALRQPETKEVILIEDGSNDGSLSVCKLLTKKYKCVILLQHLNGINRGAGASRNLGIVNAKCEYISFLDADDYYLPNRFKADMREFRKSPIIDGVYGSTGIEYESDTVKREWLIKRAIETTTVFEDLPPERLFHALLYGGYGNFTTDAITVKKSLFKETGLFDEELILHQDSAMWLKMASVGKLIPGSIDKPVAIRRVHTGNRISKIKPGDNSTRDKLYLVFLGWAINKGLDNIEAEVSYKIWKNKLLNYDEWNKKKIELLKSNNIIRVYIYALSFALKCIWKHIDLLNIKHIRRFISESF